MILEEGHDRLLAIDRDAGEARAAAGLLADLLIHQDREAQEDEGAAALARVPFLGASLHGLQGRISRDSVSSTKYKKLLKIVLDRFRAKA